MLFSLPKLLKTSYLFYIIYGIVKETIEFLITFFQEKDKKLFQPKGNIVL